MRSWVFRPARIRAATSAGMPPGRSWRAAGRQEIVTFVRAAWRTTATSSVASAPQPMTRTRGAAGPEFPSVTVIASGDTGPAPVDEGLGGLGGDRGVAAVRVGADGHAELLVERRPADHDDVIVADPAGLERLDDDLHVRHRRREEGRHTEDVGLVGLEGGDELV